MKIKKVKNILLFVLVTLFSCKKSDDRITVENSNFDVKQLLTDVTNERILTSVQEFVNEATELNVVIDTYVNETSQDNLIVVRDQWELSALAYADIYAFNIGLIRNQFTNLSLYNWPTLPNAIENFIANNSEITEDLVTALSSQAKSLSGLEYLIFKTNLSDTNTEFNDSQKRKDYLRFIAIELKNKADKLLNTWQVSGEDYANVFVDNSGTGIQSSFNLLYNGLYNLIDTGKVMKIGKPAGLENSQNTNPELTQAYFSNTSLDILKVNIQSVEKVYFNPEGLGISDYVFAIIKNDELNNAIESKIGEVQTAIDAIPVPLFEAITTHHAQVQILHQKLDELGILFSVDVRSILSIIITSTDNDGD